MAQTQFGFTMPAVLFNQKQRLTFTKDLSQGLELVTGHFDAAAYGYDFPPAHVRVEQLEEALRIIRAMWTQERATIDGRHYRVSAARCEPTQQEARAPAGDRLSADDDLDFFGTPNRSSNRCALFSRSAWTISCWTVQVSPIRPLSRFSMQRSL